SFASRGQSSPAHTQHRVSRGVSRNRRARDLRFQSKRRGKEVIRMSLSAVQSIIGRAVVNSEFREALKTDPDTVLAERDVTAEEADAIKAMDWDAVSSVGTDLEQRVSRFGIT